MSSPATAAAVDDSPGAPSAALSAEEQTAWEERLGVQTDHVPAWGRIVGAHLFAQPLNRRLAHLAHAFRVLPFVAETPEGQFPLEEMSEEEWSDRVTRLQDVGVPRRLAALQRLRSSATEMAALLLDVLSPLDTGDRAVVLAVVFRHIKGLVPAEMPQPGQTSTLTDDERAAIFVAEREAARAILGAVSHAGCDHTTREDVAGQVLDALDAIRNPMHRKVMLGFAISQLAVASSPSSGLEALAAMLGGEGPGGARIG